MSVVCTEDACETELKPKVKPVDRPLKGKNVDSGKPVDQPLKGKNVDSGAVLDVKPVDQSFEVKAVDQLLKGKLVESGVVLDVKPVYQPLEGKKNLEIAYATRFLNGGVLGGHFVQQVEADGFRNPKYDLTQLLDEGVTGNPFVHELGV